MKIPDLEGRAFGVISLANKRFWELVFGQCMRWDSDWKDLCTGGLYHIRRRYRLGLPDDRGKSGVKTECKGVKNSEFTE